MYISHFHRVKNPYTEFKRGGSFKCNLECTLCLSHSKLANQIASTPVEPVGNRHLIDAHLYIFDALQCLIKLLTKPISSRENLQCCSLAFDKEMSNSKKKWYVAISTLQQPPFTGFAVASCICHNLAHRYHLFLSKRH